jgi:sugar lactone lactonase YvrE
MNNKIYSSIRSPSGRLFAAGLVAMTILAARLQAQYVSTAITNGLAGPSYATADANGNVYITDTGNNRIVEYVPGNGAVTTLAGGDGPEYSGTNNGIGAAARFNQPQGIVYDANTNFGGLVVADQFNGLLRLIRITNGVGSVSTLPGAYSYPDGIAVDNAGNLYITDWGDNNIHVLYTNYTVSNLPVVGHTFDLPSAVALDTNGNVWVADSGNNVICMINKTTGVAQVMAGNGIAGTNDSPIATNAEFSYPSGLFWDTNKNLLVISDTLNDTIRSLFPTNYQGQPGYAVQTIAGIPGTHGLVDGALGTAEFFQPFGLCVDSTASGYYVVDTGNNALRVLQPSKPPAAPTPVADPSIGFVSYSIVNNAQTPQFNPITEPVVFNNPTNIAIEQNDSGVTTYYTYGETGSSIPTPTTASSTAPIFPQTLPLTNGPDLTIYAISEVAGRPSSDTVSARIQFVTANPSIIGNNSAAVVLSDDTSNALMLYTLDGNAPTNGASDTFGPVSPGKTISFTITSNTTLSVQASYDSFAPSGVVTAVFSPTNYAADEITFGFEGGEASSQFITAPGQTFIAPVTMTLIPSAEIMYTLQFNLAITNVVNSVTAPPIPTSGTNALTFSSMLMQQFFPGPVYLPIPPAMFYSIVTVTNSTNFITNSYLTNLLFTNTITNDLLGVGWLERPPATNLYNTMNQTLISYSIAHDTLFLNTGGEVIVGGFSFTVPTTAVVGQQYEIQIGSPSATSDGISTPVFIETPTNGSMTNGAVNSIKLVTVGQTNYLVGDVAPFYWFNAGDFGDGYLENNDVTETFQTAIYGLNGPNAATQHSDYFDAMDSSNGKDNNYYLGTDTSINSILYGDGIIAVDDVYVTYRRSLDPTLLWVYRENTSNGKYAYTSNSLLPKPFTSADPAAATAASQTANQAANSGARYITVAADQVQSGGNLSVQVPVRVLAADTLPITVMMLHVEVDPLDGSPPITDAIGFSANTNLGAEFDSATQGANDYAAVWLNSTNAGVAGTGVIGAFSVTLPSNVTSNSAYLVHFDHFSASPNGIALFHATVQDALITVGDRSGSSWNDGIPDSWRLLWFGTISNALSAANADPDGDGASNWDEYVAGTNPLDATSVFQFLPGSSFAPSGFTLQWPSVVNKHYTVQCSSSISPGNWTTLATNILGNGQTMQWTDTNATGQAQFYRALVQ